MGDVGTRARPAAAVLLLLAAITTACSASGGAFPTTTDGAAAALTALREPTVTAPTSTVTTTTEAAVPTAAVPEPPPDKDPACLQRSVFPDPTQSEYILPYPAGKAYYLMQSYCSLRPYRSHHDQMAYDWFMPVGAEVVAARGGWVVEMRESSPDNGLGASAENYVYLEHADRSVAFYAHLMQDGVDVEVGRWVDQGERIGASGNSGATGGRPHLHFGVYRAMPAYEEMGVAVSFRNAEGPLDSLGGLLAYQRYAALPGEG
ncbi:MAG: M23 family metallopeptidase [Acidimicrobiia bacterium]|nr:M23 family metallopeptidase [Acidimicrobiia bacterium]